MATCGSCGAERDAAARFCPWCGAATVRACESCGADLVPGSAFCSACGTPTASSAPSPAPDLQTASANEGERKVVTVLFADVAGSTGLAERLDPERMRVVMRAYFDAMRAAIEAEGGTVEKFIGDAVVAIFGVPSAHEDDPERALRAALAMLAALDDVNVALEREHGVRLQIRAGVNTGEVLAEVDPAPGEPIVTGDAMNVAARLQTSAEPGEVLVAERTARSARGFTFGAPVTSDLRGRAGSVDARVLLGAAFERPERGVPGLQAPLVGRDRELDLLRSVLTRSAEERSASLVTVFGEAGVGKSRLTQEFVATARDAGEATVVVGRCLPYGSGIAFWPLAEILKSLAGVADSDSRETALARIRETTATLLADAGVPYVDDIAVALSYTVGLEDPDRPLSGLDPQTVRRRMNAAWTTLFSALAAAGPVIVVIDDIHWADPALLDILEELSDRVSGPVVIVCTSRPDLVSVRPTWGGGRRNATVVNLTPLAGRDAERLVDALLTVNALPGRVRNRILASAEGNPFFLEEILRQFIDAGTITRIDDHWQAAEGIDDVDIPDTVQGVLAARIDMLPPQDKRVLRAAAVVGRTFWAGSVDVLVPAEARHGDAIEESLRRLEDRDLVISRFGSTLAGENEYLFTHILTRDVAYESIPRSERVPAHLATARWIESESGERIDEFAELVAQHYGTAIELARDTGATADESDRAQAVAWLIRASESARLRSANTSAEHLALRAIDAASSDQEQCRARVVLADAYRQDALGELGWRTLLEAAEIADRSPAIGDDYASLLYAQACEFPVRWPGMMTSAPTAEEVGALLRRGLELAPPGDSEARVRLLATEAAWAWAFPDDVPDAEIPRLTEAGIAGADMAIRLGNANLASAALDAAAGTATYAGDYASTVPIWLRRWELRDQLTDPMEIVDIHAMGAWMYEEIGEYEESIRIAKAHIDTAEEAMTPHPRVWMANSLFRLGRWDEALACCTAGIVALGDLHENPPGFAVALYLIPATIHHLRGDEAEIEKGRDVIERIRGHQRGFPWQLRWAVNTGHPDRARRMLEDPPTGWRVLAGPTWEAWCDASWSGVPVDEAADTARTAAAEGRRIGSPATIAHADRLDGIAAWRAGSLGTARAALDGAAGRFGALGARFEEARSRLALAALALTDGDTDGATMNAHAGQVVYDELRIAHDPLLDLLPGGRPQPSR
jgi:class 3 adenylate cyclase